jgi:hypothetical protein
VARYLDLFDPEGTVQHPGMTEPLNGPDITDFIHRALRLMPDFHLRPLRWCARHDTLFVEARNSGSVNGQPITWPATYCLVLRDDRVLAGRAYYDRAAVLSHQDPALAAHRDEPHSTVLDNTRPQDDTDQAHVDDPRIDTHFVQPYVDNWHAPQPERFAEFYDPAGQIITPNMTKTPVGYAEITAYYRQLIADIPDLRLTLQRWAHRPGVLFAEWTAIGTVRQQQFEVGMVERFLRNNLHIHERVSYYDSLSLPTPDRTPHHQGSIFTPGTT